MPYIVEKTLSATFQARVKTTPLATAFKYKAGTKWNSINYKDYFEECKNVSFGLMSLGVKEGDKVSILSNSRYEWVLSDMAILGTRAITVPIYASSTPEDVSFILNHSEACVVFVENEQYLQKVLSQVHSLPLLKKIILFSETDKSSQLTEQFGLEILTLAALRERGLREESHNPNRFEKNLLSTQPSDPLTICYTSGTTGTPKGAVITQANMMSVLEDCVKTFGPFLKFENEVDLLFLPFSHIIGKVESMAPYVFGWEGCFAENFDRLMVNMTEIQPTILFSVPRIFEKAFNRITASLESESPIKKKLFYWAMDASRNYHKFINENKKPPLKVSAQYHLANQLVFQKVLRRFGGRLKFALCGGAPLPSEIAQFFKLIGIQLLEGYGLTETCGPVSINSPNASRIGTVGRPLPEVVIKTAEDGEILIQSKKVFIGYYKLPKETADILENGWFMTGDIGHIDEEGYLHITDRKKDLIITSGGKNVAPQKIESLMKTQRFINHFVVHGDRRHFLTALVTLDKEQISQYANENKILFSDYPGLLQNPKIQSLIQKEVDEVNERLASFERIKKFILLPDEFTVDSGDLTPSLKVKRNKISKKYKTELDKMYSV